MPSGVSSRTKQQGKEAWWRKRGKLYAQGAQSRENARESLAISIAHVRKKMMIQKERMERKKGGGEGREREK